MAQRTCDIDGCERAHWARGLCSSHYSSCRRKAGRVRRDEYFDITCVTCGSEHRSARRDGKYCSLVCRDFDKWGPRTCDLPRAADRPKPAPKPKPEPFREQRECAWCGDAFVATKRAQMNCSKKCKERAIKYRRRGRQYGSASHFTWSEFMRLFIAFDRRCAYCDQRITGQPDPDHVVPLSKGGSNGITNILPACRLCNGDKRDLLLTEWAADRDRRGLPARNTNSFDDPRWIHLTDALLAA